MRRVLTWLGIVLVAVVAVVAIGAVIVVVDTNREVAANVTPLPPPTTLGHASLDRGRHLYTAISGCVDCHRADGGGGPFINDPVMAVLNATNLTRGPGGVGTLYGEWVDGTPFESNRYVDRFVVKGGQIVKMDVWNDSAERILVQRGIEA